MELSLRKYLTVLSCEIFLKKNSIPDVWLRVLHIEFTFVPNLEIKPKKYSVRKNEKAKGRGSKVNRASVYAEVAVQGVL